MNSKTTFLSWLGSLMIGLILLLGTGQLMAQVSLEITPGVLDLGNRPIDAWMEPLPVTLENTSASSLVINNVETDNPEYFGLDLPILPLTIEAGETVEIGVFLQGTPAAGNLSAQLVVQFANAARDIIVAPISANAYTAIAPDVVENAVSLPIVPAASASLPIAASRENGGYYKNYILPNDLGSGANDLDQVFMLEPTSDVIVNFQTDLGMINFAIYDADFNGEGGPMATNALVQGIDLIEDFELFTGTYYLVLSSLDLSEASYSVTAMPAPDAAVYVAPEDGAVDIINGMDLEWAFGANTLEYQVVLGTTYPPTNVVVDWTSSQAEASSPLNGTWMVANEVGCIGVGPVQGDIGWWSFLPGDLAERACFMDDKYVFNADGSFQNVQDDLTFIESWQGGSNNCGTPVAPHDGSANATYEYNENAGTLTLNGVGAYLGLPKAVNGSELNNPNNAPASITYLMQLTDGGNAMVLDVNVGGGWWRFKMVKEASVPGTYNLTNLQPNLQYFWQVNTRNNNSTTLNPNIWGFTTTLSPPTGLSGNAEVYEGEDVVLSWESPVDRAFLGYNVYRDGVQQNADMLTQSSYTDDSPAYNITGYNYNVTAIYDEGESDFSTTFLVHVTGEGTLNGHVSDLNTGDDIAGATVTMTGLDEFGMDQSYSTTTDATGNYTAEVFAGTYDISVTANGYISAEETDVAVAYNGTTTTDFTLFETAFPVAIVTASEFDENILIEWSFDPASGDRALVEFQVWREEAYLPGAFDMIGTTSQFQFVDFDWSLQDWGVYKWYVVAVYDLNESDPVASNPVDKDMNTTVDVTVALNSAESPAGTSVVFSNVDESPELVYETTLDETGAFNWEAFRKGTYDIEVSLDGFATITETAVDIFDETSFSWLLIEALTEPASLYVSPTGLASWSTSASPEESPLEGTWMVANEPGSMGVGPFQGSMLWWSIGPANLIERECFFDDKYVFSADGSFQNVMDNLTFLEAWQGGSDNCGTPVAPHDGSVAATFEYDENAGTVTLNGIGAYMGLPKVYNGGELNNPNNAPESITYIVDLSEDGNTMILDISVGGGWWRFKMVREGAAARALESYKIFLDGTLLGEQSETEYQHGGFGEALVDGETYTTGVATVYTTGQSATTEFAWKYVACDNYDTPAAFTAAQVDGTLNIMLSWTNVNAAALDTVSALRIYRNGEYYNEIDFTADAVSSFTDENLGFDTYNYCLTYIYDSGAETCTGAVCSADVDITGGGFVNGTVTAVLGGAAIEGATVTVSNDSYSFVFTTNTAGFYEGEVVAGTYEYLVEAIDFEVQTLEDVTVPYGATITNNFALLEYPFGAGDVVATEVSDNVVQVEWSLNTTRGLTGYSVYRTTCETGELQFLGFTLDQVFTDNTWGTAESGVYKWGVVAEYDLNNAQIAFSNCLDKDMITQVSVTVTTNSLDSPNGTQVMFTNISEPDLGLVYETTLNATGYFMWEEFRKGTYDITAIKTGFEPIELMNYVIEGPEDFVWILSEQLLPVTDLYVNPNGLASWGGVGGATSPLQGTWQVAAELGSMGVGGSQGDMSYWSVGDVDLEVRGCFWDDRFIFNGDGTFHNEFDDLTYLEPWQGVNYECGVPVAPHDGSANATFEYDEEAGTITLNGVGAFLGLAKVYNGGELTTPNDAPASITYLFELTDDGNTMIVDINANGDWWRFKLVKTGSAVRALQGYKVWLDGIFVTDTPDTFWQYDETNLVEGQEYFSEVAAIYSNGISAKMNYTWTYYSCENYPGPENLAGSVSGMDVTLTWGSAPPPPPPGGDFFEGFEDGTLPTGWVTYDEDGDSYIWENTAVEFDVFEAHNGLYCMTSASYRNDVGALTPDNWLVTPAINVTAASELNFWVSAQDAAWSDEQYYVKVSTTGNAVADFTETVHTAISPATWGEVTIDLSAFAGETIYIAFQHADVTDMFFIKLDDVTVTNTATRAAYTSPMAAGVSNGMPFKTLGMSQSEIDTRYDNLPAIARHDHSEMDANAEVRTVGMSREMWDLQYSFDIDTPSGLTGLAGAETDGEFIYATKWAGSEIVKFDVDGNFIETFSIPGVSGLRDLAFDGTYMYGAAAATTVYKMDFTNKTLVSSFTAPVAVRAIAYDDDLNAFWGNNWSADMVLFDESGATLNTLTGMPSMYGAAYDNFSDGGPYLWFFTGTTTGGGSQVEQYDIAGGAMTGVSHSVSAELGDLIAGGLYISDDLVTDKVIIGGTGQGTPDLAFAFELMDNSGGGGGGDFETGPVAGVNVYRDGMLIAEMVQDTFYVDPDVDYGMYTYCVTYVYESGAESCSEACIDLMIMEACDAPENLVVENLSTELGPQEIKLTWNENVTNEFRYDDGIRTAQLGSSTGTLNTVLGNKHNVSADLTEMSWFLSDAPDGGGPHATIQIYVFGLTSAGIPDGNNVLYTASVSNTDGMWNTHTFPETIVADGGFFLGVAYAGFVGIGTDDGVGAPYEFQPNTQYFTGDYTAGAWDTWETFGFNVNAMIRATGVENAVASFVAETIEPTEAARQANRNAGQTLELRKSDVAVNAGQPAWTSAPANRSNRDILGFNIYKNGELLEALWPENTYTYEEAVAANFCYTVTAEYEFCGESEPSNEACIEVITGLGELGTNTARMFPNPATDMVTIEASGMNRITVINAVGQVIYDLELNNNNTQLNVASFEAGVYVIRINTESGIATKRLMIVR